MTQIHTTATAVFMQVTAESWKQSHACSLDALIRQSGGDTVKHSLRFRMPLYCFRLNACSSYFTKKLYYQNSMTEIFSFLFPISEACHVRSHLASTADSGQPRASRPPDVPLCRVSHLQSPQQEGRVGLPAKIWSLWPERRRRRRRDGQQIHGYWTYRWDE